MTWYQTSCCHGVEVLSGNESAPPVYCFIIKTHSWRGRERREREEGEREGREKRERGEREGERGWGGRERERRKE